VSKWKKILDSVDIGKLSTIEENADVTPSDILRMVNGVLQNKAGIATPLTASNMPANYRPIYNSSTAPTGASEDELWLYRGVLKYYDESAGWSCLQACK
jgi:hypothetical protein